jgi:hypothetical protein
VGVSLVPLTRNCTRDPLGNKRVRASPMIPARESVMLPILNVCVVRASHDHKAGIVGEGSRLGILFSVLVEHDQRRDGVAWVRQDVCVQRDVVCLVVWRDDSLRWASSRCIDGMLLSSST